MPSIIDRACNTASALRHESPVDHADRRNTSSCPEISRSFECTGGQDPPPPPLSLEVATPEITVSR